MPRFLILMLAFASFTACKDQQDVKFEHDAEYENSKEVLRKKEEDNPLQFLSIHNTTKKNLLKKTVIKGTLFNNAKVVAYKDVEIKLRFFSPTGALLEEDVETFYTEIPPGGSKPFKSKYMAPKSADSVVVTVSSAKF